MSEFSGKALLVTGAAGGIGEAVARAFLEAGARVLLADLREEPLSELARSLDPGGGAVAALAYDAARPEDAERAVRLCLDRFGRLDFLVPAAGVFEDHAFTSMTDEQWRRTISINLDGVFYICRRAVPVMPEGGSIVTIASEAAHAGSSVRHSHYGASKGGVMAFTKSLARELAPRIRVNAVSPGTIDTPMIEDFLRLSGEKQMAATPMRRWGSPREVADAVAFLCGKQASYVTGQTIHVNGGSYMGG
jgi:3-oxoacyl-[acyl-carrier protein] reductase